jgi:hypothetical protein
MSKWRTLPCRHDPDLLLLDVHGTYTFGRPKTDNNNLLDEFTRVIRLSLALLDNSKLGTLLPPCPESRPGRVVIKPSRHKPSQAKSIKPTYLAS